MMFPKAFLVFLAIGALSVNALSTPVVREPTPELDFQDIEARRAWHFSTTASPQPTPTHKAKKHGFWPFKREPASQDVEARGAFEPEGLVARFLHTPSPPHSTSAHKPAETHKPKKHGKREPAPGTSE